MSKMKIYHTVKGGGEVVTADEVDKISVPMRVKQIQSDGGFWTDTSFIPWNSITYVEFDKAPEDAAKPVAAVKYAGPERRVKQVPLVAPERRKVAFFYPA
jgi:hypothetical protein